MPPRPSSRNRFAEEADPRERPVAANPLSDTYCEMGIDVRAYAMANTDVKRAASVGAACAPNPASPRLETHALLAPGVAEDLDACAGLVDQGVRFHRANDTNAVPQEAWPDVYPVS